jgi:hypothetical protein
VLAIQNYGPSGTLFVQSLLDEHPYVLLMPGLYLRDFYTYWERFGALSYSQKLNAFETFFPELFEPNIASEHWGLHQMGPNMDQSIKIDRKLFFDNFRKVTGNGSDNSRRDFLVSAFAAYALTIGRELRSEMILVFPVHTLPLEKARRLVEDFPESYFLHMVREPIRAAGSLYNHVRSLYFHKDPVKCAFAQMINDHIMHSEYPYHTYGSTPYLETYRFASRAVRLEDIHKAPKETLQMICDWVGIPWGDSLLKSTFNGLQWWNRPESKRVKGFDKELVEQKHEEVFDSFDRARLGPLFKSRYEAWGYTLPSEVIMSKSWKDRLPFSLWRSFSCERLIWKSELSRFHESSEHRRSLWLNRVKRRPYARFFLRTPLRPLVYVAVTIAADGRAFLKSLVPIVLPYFRARKWLLLGWMQARKKNPGFVTLLSSSPANPYAPFSRIESAQKYQATEAEVVL